MNNPKLDLDEKSQKEISAFLEQEQAKARLNSSIHTFTRLCWKKCMTGAPGNKFSRTEEPCLINCVDRFLDTSLFMMGRMQQLQGGQGGQEEH